MAILVSIRPTKNSAPPSPQPHVTPSSSWRQNWTKWIFNDMKRTAKSQKGKHSLSPLAKRAQSAKQPPSSSEVVLLAVIGMSPAILTETIWALAEEQPAVLP